MLFFHAFAEKNRVIGLFCLFFRQNATVNFSSKTVIVWSHFCTFLGQEGTSERTPRVCLKSWEFTEAFREIMEKGQTLKLVKHCLFDKLRRKSLSVSGAARTFTNYTKLS